MANQALCCFETHTVVCALCGENISDDICFSFIWEENDLSKVSTRTHGYQEAGCLKIEMTTFVSASSGKKIIYQKFRPEPKATKKLDVSKLR